MNFNFSDVVVLFSIAFQILLCNSGLIFASHAVSFLFQIIYVHLKLNFAAGKSMTKQDLGVAASGCSDEVAQQFPPLPLSLHLFPSSLASLSSFPDSLPLCLSFFSVWTLFLWAPFSQKAGMIVTRNSRFRWYLELLTPEQDWCSLFSYLHDKP